MKSCVYEQVEPLLSGVEKPARYTGGEVNAVRKDPEAVAVNFAFCFPDTYEVGMSHLGMKILYEIINDRPDAWCQRVFAPWVDMERAMRQAGVPLYALESGIPLAEFDIVGFTLQYEMSYTNVLNMLDLAGIPVRSADRGADMPLVIAGGPCAFNPEPLAPFIDLFVVGDGETVTGQLIELYQACPNRADFLRRACALQGVYVPAFYDVSYNVDGTVASIVPNVPEAPEMVVKAMEADLDHLPSAEHPVVPFVEAVHDRIMLEIFRGCTRGCRFCQAGMIYRPVRERRMETLLDMAREMIRSTGYEEMSLSSLSTGDYSCLNPLVKQLMEEFAPRRVALSLPSLRVDSEVAQTMEQIQRVRKTGLTFAPEAGTQRLRDVINKGVSEQDLIHSVTEAFQAGWNGVKLYFMMGLPTETYEDLAGIAELVKAVNKAYYSIPKGQRQRGMRVTASTACFVPKPHTPFQWCAQDSLETFADKQRFLREQLRMPNVTYNWHEAQLSYLEAVFARGDRRTADALEAGWRAGCRFDGWAEHFRFDLWTQAFERTGVDADFYATRARALDEVLPWSHISCGVSEAYLKREYQRAMSAQVTPDCRGNCTGCGVNHYVGGKCPCA
ncbi:MAG: TIGR03960 family B12-binding radical SAM protein [Christensenellales bacterium]